jgi:hypothetical protein
MTAPPAEQQLFALYLTKQEATLLLAHSLIGELVAMAVQDGEPVALGFPHAMLVRYEAHIDAAMALYARYTDSPTDRTLLAKRLALATEVSK